MNRVTLIGNVTKDLELLKTPNDISYCKFSIAVNRKFVAENKEREVDFFNIVVWRGLAENCVKFLSKGKKVCVSGTLQNDNYTDKQNVARTITNIIADEVEFLTMPTQNVDKPLTGNIQTANEVSSNLPDIEDELPF